MDAYDASTETSPASPAPPKTAPVEIDVPPGFHAPDPSEMKDGVVTLTCDWRALPGGKRLRLVKLGDFDMPDTEGGEKEPSNADMGQETADAIMANRGGQTSAES